MKGVFMVDFSSLAKDAGSTFEKIKNILSDGTVTVDELRGLGLPDPVIQKADELDKDGNGLGMADIQQLMQQFPEIKDKLLSHFQKK